MKRILACAVLLLFLAGCAGENAALDRCMAMRQKLLSANGCSFDATVTADYGTACYSFTMSCQADAAGNVTFTVQEPETISGITGVIGAEGGKLTFDGQALAFQLLADGQISPVSAPWLLIRTLRGGYLSSCSAAGEGLLLCVDDSYESDALRLDIRLDSNDLPIQAEILYDGRRIVSLEVRNFAYL